jgi:hypothetical protein
MGRAALLMACIFNVPECSHRETILSHILCLCSYSRILNDYSFHCYLTIQIQLIEIHQTHGSIYVVLKNLLFLITYLHIIT